MSMTAKAVVVWHLYRTPDQEEGDRNLVGN